MRNRESSNPLQLDDLTVNLKRDDAAWEPWSIHAQTSARSVIPNKIRLGSSSAKPRLLTLAAIVWRLEARSSFAAVSS
jgi:hypothetical protein